MRHEHAPPRPSWQQELADCIACPADLATELGLTLDDLAGVRAAAGMFPLRVPRSYVARMRHGDPDDPLLRQVLPLGIETRPVAGYGSDPVGDLASTRGAGILQKYHGRALLIATGACAVHCRYCFRRSFPYAHHALRNRELDQAIGMLAQDRTIGEIILSGGDPLSLTDARLGELLSRLGDLPHLRRIRIHTRLPIVLPARVDEGLAAVLAGAAKPLIVVVHANHAHEIDGGVKDALARLAEYSALLLNQSVLLAGVNDSVAALVELSEALFAAGVLPYYLHQLDPVAGAAHFQISDEQARRLLGAVTGRLPGYLVPRLVRERAGAAAKDWLTPTLHNSVLHNMTYVT